MHRSHIHRKNPTLLKCYYVKHFYSKERKFGENYFSAEAAECSAQLFLSAIYTYYIAHHLEPCLADPSQA